jgi:hypothetical protein
MIIEKKKKIMIFVDRSMLKYYLGVRDSFVNKGGMIKWLQDY